MNLNSERRQSRDHTERACHLESAWRRFAWTHSSKSNTLPAPLHCRAKRREQKSFTGAATTAEAGGDRRVLVGRIHHTSGTRAMERKVERASRSRSSLEKAIQSTHLFHLQMTTGRFALHTMLRDAVVVATGFMFAECVDAGNRIRCGSTTKV